MDELSSLHSPRVTGRIIAALHVLTDGNPEIICCYFLELHVQCLHDRILESVSTRLIDEFEL